MGWERIRDVIVETLNCDSDRVTPDARLREDLGADSLAAVELVMALEESTGITVDDALLNTFVTVQDILDYWNRHME